jgi:hypothetical protein
VRLRIAVAIVIAVALAGTIGFAQGQGRVEHWEETFTVDGQFMGPCGDFVILSRYSAHAAYTDLYAKDGQLVQTIARVQGMGRSVYFLAESVDNKVPLNDKVVMGVPHETEVDRWEYLENLIYVKGSIFQATLPHYGRIFSQTGLVVLDMTTFEPLFTSGHNQYLEQDVAALCDYLK